MFDSNEDSRELTPAEKLRREKFEKTKEELTEKGYEAKELTVNIIYANVMAVVFALPITGIFAALFFIFNKGVLSGLSLQLDLSAVIKLVIFVAVLFVLVIVHELIHGITWSLFTKKRFRAISFGFIAKYLTPYCTCDESLKKGQYIAGTLMPTLLLGVVPALVSVFTGSLWLLVTAAIMIFSGGGDLTIVSKLITFKARGKEAVYMDHPYKCGLVAFVKAADIQN